MKPVHLWEEGFRWTIRIPGNNSCTTPPPGSLANQGFESSIPSGADSGGNSSGSIQWQGNIPSSAVDPESWNFSGQTMGLTGVSDVTVGDTRQIKSATMLTDMVRDGDVLTVRKFAPGQIGALQLNGFHDQAGKEPFEVATFEGAEQTDPMTAEVLSSHLQVSVVQDSQTVSWYELDYDGTTGKRTKTDHLTGIREAMTIATGTAGEKIETREEYRYSPSQSQFVLTSRVRDTYEEGSGELMETVVDPGGADLATWYYRDLLSGATATLSSDGSWTSRSLKHGSYLVGVDGEVDLNDWGDVTGTIRSVSYRPWLDSELPISKVPSAEDCVAELEIDMGDLLGTIRRETRIEGHLTRRVDTWKTIETEVVEGPEFLVQRTRTWYSDDEDNTLTREVWIYREGDWGNRTYKTVAEDGLVKRLAYEKGDFVPPANPAGSGFTPSPSGAFLCVSEWDTTGVVGGSTGTSRVEAKDGRVVEECLKVFTGGTSWAIMCADTWTYNDGHAEGKESRHYKNGVLMDRSLGNNTGSIQQSAGGPARITLLDADGEVTSVTEDYPEPFADIVTTHARDGQKSIVTRAAGALSETSVTEFDVAGRVISSTDTRGITHNTTYDEANRIKTRIGPGENPVTEISVKYIDGRQKITSGTGSIAGFRSYSVSERGMILETSYRGSTDNTGPRWLANLSDWGGRVVQTSRPSPTLSGEVTESSEYDPATGRLTKVSSTGVADRLYIYDSLGRLMDFGLDLEGNDDALVPASKDRITRTAQEYLEIGGRWWDQSTTSVYHTDDNGTATYVSIARNSVAPLNEGGAARWSSVTVQPGGLTFTSERTESFDPGTSASAAVQTTDSSATSASSDTTASSTAGRLISIAQYGALQASKFEYDAFGRTIKTTNPLGGTNRTIYDAFGQVVRQINHVRNVTSTDYYPPGDRSAGLVRRISNAELESVEYVYDSLGHVKEVFGNGTYRLSYGYDNYGDLVTMTTYASGGAGGTTTWVRDPGTGFVGEKIHPNGKGPNYTYYADGKPRTRTWERGAVTTWSYNTARDLIGIAYSGETPSTPNVTIETDRLGRPKEVTDGGGTITRSYDLDVPQETTDVYDPDHSWLPGVIVDRSWDATTGERLHSGAKRGTTFDQKTEFLADPATGLLWKVTDAVGGIVHSYSYTPGTALITGIAHSNSGGTMFAEEIRQTDLASRLYAIETRSGTGEVLQLHRYLHDKVDRRIRATREDGTYWAYGYSDRGEVVSGKKHLPDTILRANDGDPLAGHQFEYHYDGLGNREWSRSGGDEDGLNLRQTDYAPDEVNQYRTIKTPGSFDVLGRAPAVDTVTVNSGPTLRQGERFQAELIVSNNSGPVWQGIAVSDGHPPDVEGHRHVPATEVELEYDDDGNLLFDGRWEYVWDTENRLVEMANQTAASNHRASGEPFYKLRFGYDWMGRRIRKQVFDSITNNTPAKDLRFAYDDWDMIAEYTGGSALTLQRSYTGGIDLSGTKQGAGGVGGILSVRDGGTSYAASYDGNGNIVGWVDVLGDLASRREYDPSGNTIIHENTLNIPYGFSTKYEDAESGLYYFNYRYYSPSSGRWISRDPIEERGGINYVGFVTNDSINKFDLLGMEGRKSDDVRRNFLYIMGPESMDPMTDAMMAAVTHPNFDGFRYIWGDPLSQNNHLLRIGDHNPSDDSEYLVDGWLLQAKRKWEKNHPGKRCCIRFKSGYQKGDNSSPMTPRKIWNILTDKHMGKAHKKLLAAHSSFKNLFLGVGVANNPGTRSPTAWGGTYTLESIFKDFPNKVDLDIYTCYDKFLSNQGNVKVDGPGMDDAISDWSLIREKIVEPWALSECDLHNKNITDD
ncbi:RHS repeat-associated core domain-containing protein [Luteolibacter sp. Populi]|uniref:RHS repeat-associated core domain-containing protein n=1 Tax=Luteolibacter sp. Populi TaxID=3230487 RepID=UPI0034658BA1